MTEINMTSIDDAGPISNVPKLLGICTEHGWWFEAATQQEGCPEVGCYAPVHIYIWRTEHKPDDPSQAVCPRCDGSGEIQVGGSSLNPRVGVCGPDPQCDDVVRCPECGGEGAR